jgi:hypothetical protein
VHRNDENGWVHVLQVGIMSGSVDLWGNRFRSIVFVTETSMFSCVCGNRGSVECQKHLFRAYVIAGQAIM